MKRIFFYLSFRKRVNDRIFMSKKTLQTQSVKQKISSDILIKDHKGIKIRIYKYL
jgi:hypothetical protein